MTLFMRTLFLVAGHTQGKDPGARVETTTEHAEVARIMQSVAEHLDGAGVPVVLVPFTLKLQEKIAWINARATSADMLVSLHMNSAGSQAHGMEVWYQQGRTEDHHLAQRALAQLHEHIALRARGVFPDTKNRHGRLGIIRDTYPQAILLELGFLTNRRDLDRVRAAGVDALCAVLPLLFAQA